MDENAISVMCEVHDCEWRVVGDVRCPQHGGLPVYSWAPSIYANDREFTDPVSTQPVERGNPSEATTA